MARQDVLYQKIPFTSILSHMTNTRNSKLPYDSQSNPILQHRKGGKGRGGAWLQSNHPRKRRRSEDICANTHTKKK